MKSTFKTTIDPVANPANKYLKEAKLFWNEIIVMKLDVDVVGLLVVVRQCQRPDRAIKGWIGIEKC